MRHALIVCIVLCLLLIGIAVASFARSAAPAAIETGAQNLATSPEADPLYNPAIDAAEFLRIADDAIQHRATRRIDEQEFLRLSEAPGVVILDARSAEKYELMHISGAINLPFPDIDIASLEEMIPDKSTLILIYCNNNFRNAQRAFPSKLAGASLNLSTYATLFGYGYRNVYELALLKDPAESSLPFAGTLVTESADSERSLPVLD